MEDTNKSWYLLSGCSPDGQGGFERSPQAAVLKVFLTDGRLMFSEAQCVITGRVLKYHDLCLTERGLGSDAVFIGTPGCVGQVLHIQEAWRLESVGGSWWPPGPWTGSAC